METIDKEYIDSLRTRIGKTKIPGLMVSIIPDGAFPFHLRAEVADTYVFGYGHTFDGAVANITLRLPDRVSVAAQQRERAAALLESAAKLEREAAA